MTSPRRPVLRYHGGKWRLAPWVIASMPPHEVYVEAFGGGASVLMRKPPARIEVYNDSDESVVNLFRILRDPVRAEALREALVLTPFSRREFEACLAVSEDPLEEARRLIVRSFQSIGTKSRFNANGWRSRAVGRRWSPGATWGTWPEQISTFVARLRHVIIECSSWEKVLGVYDAPTTLFYLDPPYVHETRKARYKKVYQFEMTNDQHRELLARAATLRGMVLLSGYAHPLYEEALSSWQRLETSARAQTNVLRTEVLWINPACQRALARAAVPQLLEATA